MTSTEAALFPAVIALDTDQWIIKAWWEDSTHTRAGTEVGIVPSIARMVSSVSL